MVKAGVQSKSRLEARSKLRSTYSAGLGKSRSMSGIRSRSKSKLEPIIRVELKVKNQIKMVKVKDLLGEGQK